MHPVTFKSKNIYNIAFHLLCMLNPLMGTLKRHSNGSLYSHTVVVHWPLMGGLLHLVQRGGA